MQQGLPLVVRFRFQQRLQALQFETVHWAAFAAVHVVAKRQHQLEYLLQLLALLYAQRRRTDRVYLWQQVLVRVGEVAHETHDAEFLREPFDFGQGEQELILFGQQAHILAAVHVRIERFEL